jgi:amidohydrolase
MNVQALIDKRLGAVVNLRHRLHQIPELMYEEFETAAAIRGELDQLGIKYVAGVEGAPTATVAWVGNLEKPCIALRSDIDALPILEQTGLAYASDRPGKMHACGHDGHMAGLMGVAGIVKELAERLPVCVKFLWQPAEEGGAGAQRMVQAGVLDGRIGPKVEAIFGLHGWPGLAVGSVATKGGVLMAATDNFTVKVKGKGCHGAFPHLGKDPIVAACEMVGSLQHVASRDMDPTEPSVVTVGIFNAGTAVNVIPDVVEFSGTSRTLGGEPRIKIRKMIERRCLGVGMAHGCEVDFELHEGYPATVNDPAMADYVATVVRKELGNDSFVPVGRPSMGGEDFAYYLEQVPGCFFLVGVRPHGRGEYPSLHNDRFDFTDEALGVGMKVFLGIVQGWR